MLPVRSSPADSEASSASQAERVDSADPFLLHVCGERLSGITPAKVNLFLEILGRRPDGYHELNSLFLSLDWFDSLEVEVREQGRLTLECQPHTIPTDERNLVLKAALALQTAAGFQHGAHFRLTKRIPQEAGLGGGSSDAGLTLRLLNRLWQLNWSTEALRQVAATVGSDVAFFLAPLAAWCQGRGEQVTPTVWDLPLDLLILKPPFGLSTPAVYRAYQPGAARGAPTADAVRQARTKPDLALTFRNDLAASAFAIEPRLHRYQEALQQTGALGVQLSGSGSCLFALMPDRATALRGQARLKQSHPEAQVAVTRAPAFPGRIQAMTTTTYHQTTP